MRIRLGFQSRDTSSGKPVGVEFPAGRGIEAVQHIDAIFVRHQGNDPAVIAQVVTLDIPGDVPGDHMIGTGHQIVSQETAKL